MARSPKRNLPNNLLAFAFGAVFISVILIIAIAVPNPSPFAYTVFRIVLALAAAGVAAVIPGFLRVEVSTIVRAGGAIAVFVIIYFFSPAVLPPPNDTSIATPIAPTPNVSPTLTVEG